MTSGLEFEGKDVEEAVKNACAELNIKEDKLKYDVISYGSTGIFGLVGVKKAKIRVVGARKKHERKKASGQIREAEPEHSILRDEDREDIKSLVKESFGDLGVTRSEKAKRRKEKNRRPKEVPERVKLAAEESDSVPEETGETGFAPEEAEETGSVPEEAQETGSVPEGAEETGSVPEGAEETGSVPEGAEETGSVPEEAKETGSVPEGAEEAGKELLEMIVDLITTGTEVKTETIGPKLRLNVTGGNPAVLIGKKGQTLEAIQYLVEKVLSKKCGERVRVVVDVEGYLETRKQNLLSLSSRLADKAKRIGKPVTIGHMNSHDRRIVHTFLKNDREIRTQSVGDGFYRKLVIFPKKGKKNKNRKNK